MTQIRQEFTDQGIPVETVFPYDFRVPWNPDFYGPLVLPNKGQEVLVNKDNNVLYAKVIETEQFDHSVVINNHGVLEIDGEPVTSYTFQHNYYFMMGDNRNRAADSRFKGLVAEDQIQGKALYIAWSDQLKRIGRKL